MLPSTTRHEMPGAAVRAAQIASSGPFGSPDGFACHPARLAALPRTNTTVDPSADMRTLVRSTPSSFRYLVRRTGVNAGGAAV
ncbi:MAG: hypothetical protein DMF91_23950 [Acidobacteria bacterium]|nr:MAG: hypothetical protein DMF91_23950 [Acidobacteriota bacterium]